ncbi:MAG: hypothetical protein ACRYF3_02085 [Janthinobacterium lividum]
MQEQRSQPENTGAIAGVVAAGAGVVVSAALWPLSLVMGLVVVALGVRALHGGTPVRGWWTAALVVAVLCLATSAIGLVTVLNR